MIKKNYLLISILLLQIISFEVKSQIVYKGLNPDNSTYLLGATAARKSQCIYRPNDFNNLPMNGQITKIYYRYGATGITTAHDLSPFTIKMGQTSDTVFQGGTTFFTGLITVLFDSVYTIAAGVQGDWFGIDLQNTFAYDSSKTLIVEIQFYNNTVLNFGTLGSSNNSQKLISDDTAAVAETGFGSSTWQDFGFDYLTPTGLVNANTLNDLIVFPNPSFDYLNINHLFLKENGIISIMDVCGKTIYIETHFKENSSAVIDISTFEQGIYFLKIDSQNKTITKKIVKY